MSLLGDDVCYLSLDEANGFVELQGERSMIDNGFHDVLGQAKRLLADSPFEELRLLHVEMKDEAVFLRGQVPTFYMKQLAQETVRSATRGVQLVNDVNVA